MPADVLAPGDHHGSTGGRGRGQHGSVALQQVRRMSGDCQYPPLRARRTVGEMPKETKDQAAKRESIRLTKRLKWVLWLPIACVILCAGWLTRMFRTPKSTAELRAADKGRQ